MRQRERSVFQKGFGACKAVSRRGLNETKSLVPFNKTKAQEVCKCHLQPPRTASASLPAAGRHREARAASSFDS